MINLEMQEQVISSADQSQNIIAMHENFTQIAEPVRNHLNAILSSLRDLDDNSTLIPQEQSKIIVHSYDSAKYLINNLEIFHNNTKNLSHEKY